MALTYTPEQKRIIDDTPVDSDLLIVAGAGSGKTFTMTQRILRLLRGGKDGDGRPVDPGSILGLTFTTKAAGELDRRVRAAVEERRSAGQDLASRPHISTYDAFFQQIVREYGLLIGIDPQTQPLSAAGLHELAGRVVGEHMGDILAAFQKPDPLLPGVEPDVGGYAELVGQILSLASQILSYMIDEDRPTFEEALADATRWNDAFVATCAKALSRLKEGDGPVLYAEALHNYLDDPSGSESAVKIRKTDKARKAQQTNAYVRGVGRVARLYQAARRRAVVLGLAGDFQRLKKAEGMADFADFTAYALRLVRRFPSIGARYRRQYRFVFLDEYQDTSTTQAKLIAQLFHPSGQDAVTSDGPARSVTTAVGDPFQSIYGWRGASPSAFTLFQDDFGLTGDPQTLSMTHRNKDLVLGLANMLTGPLRDPARLGRGAAAAESGADGADDAAAADNGEDRADSAASDASGASTSTARKRTVRVRPLRPMRLPGQEDEKPGEGATVTAAGFAQADQEIRAVTLWAKDQVGRLAPLRAADQPRRPLVAVLLRAKTHMDEYVSALEDEGLDVQVVGLDHVLDRPEVRDLLAVLTCVADHTAVPSVMRLLATPRYGLGSSDLRALARAADDLNARRQYDGLVAAGLATGREDEAGRATLVRAHRDSLPVLSTLIDLLLESDTLPDDLLDPLSPSARGAVSSLSRVLRAVEAAQPQGLTATISTAVRSLGLPTDVALAHVVEHPDEVPVPPAASRATTEAVMELVDTYMSELLDTSSATLRGFVSWVRDQDSDIAAAAPTVQEADVVVMTIHQAKGLEWPAVAVAGMTARNFPSQNTVSLNQRLSPPRAVAHTWAEDPGSVPAPMRSDADILPPFPHTLRAGQDPVAALGELADDPSRLGQEVFAPDTDELSKGTRGQDYPVWPSLQEEYGRRAHAEERRLAYVAVTRSSGDVLLTFSGHGSATGRDPDGVLRADDGKAGLFWNESLDYLTRLHSDGQMIPVEATGLPDRTRSGKSTLTGLSQMTGAAFGPRARQTLEAFNEHVPAATADDVAGENDPLLGQLLWPARVPRTALRVLTRSAQVVSQQISEDPGPDGVKPSDKAGEADTPMPLTQRARQLLDIAQREKRRREGDGADQSLAQRARAALKGRSVPTTTLQRLSSVGSSAGSPAGQGARSGRSAQSGQRADDLLLQIVRPMPQPPNEAAGLGTLFHNWVAGLLDPLTEEPLTAGIPDRGDTQEQIARLGEGSAEARRLARWQKAFRDSLWAQRQVVAVERPYDMALAGHRIPARLDAVFAGAIDDAPGQEQEGRYTVVDWKTGRPPRTPAERDQRLLQLDLYRIAFSRARGVPIEAVDACLFYVGAPAGRRQIGLVRRRGEQEILAQILANPTAATVLGEDFDEEVTGSPSSD